jgi:hypothetical protein
MMKSSSSYCSHLYIHQKISNEKMLQKRAYKAGVNGKGKSQQATRKASRCCLQEKTGEKNSCLITD